MPDQKITSLSATTTPASTDILPIVIDPGGTPLNRKVTVANLFASAANLTLATNTLRVANTTNAQTLEIYGTTDSNTSPVNYERLRFNQSGGIFFIQSEKGGTGVVRPIQISAGSNLMNIDADGAINFRTSGGTNRWNINSSGHFMTGLDNTYDIGASGATRPRTIYSGTEISAGTNLRAGAALVVTTFGQFGAGGNISVIASTGDGIFRLSNAGLTDFSRLQFGGTTSSFPSIKRSGVNLVAQLADDSAPTGFLSKRVVAAKTSAYPVVAADTDTVFTNEGAGAGVTFTLPTPVAGLQYTFIVLAAQALTIVPATGASEAIYVTTLDANDSIASSTVGHSITLVAVNTTQWVAVAFTGSWP